MVMPNVVPESPRPGKQRNGGSLLALPGVTSVRYMDIPVESLLKSPGNKRAFNEERARDIASRWDPFLAQTAAVSDRDGQFFAIDGWTRIGAARFANRTTMGCMVCTGMTPADEAKAFDILNTNRVRISAENQFWSRIDYGEPVAIQVKRVCDALGIRLVSRPPQDATASRAYAALQTIVARHGEKVLEETLTVLRRVWPDEPKCLESTTVLWFGGFLTLYGDHPNFSTRKFVERVRRVSLATFWQRVQTIRGARAATDSGGSSSMYGPPAARMVLVDLYNRQVEEANRLPDATQADMRRKGAGQNPWKD
jgi:hypothetical protein